MAETADLLSSLREQREHVLGILDGLTDEALRTPVLPSGWTCVGLVHHLAVDVERFWFRAVISGEPGAIAEVGTESDSAWVVGPEVGPSAVLDLYRAEATRSDAVLAGRDPGEPPAWWPQDLFGSWRLDSVREIALHVISETAVHAGHLDAVRELMDGRQWLVLTG